MLFWFISDVQIKFPIRSKPSKKALHMTIHSWYHSVNQTAGFTSGFVFSLQRWSSSNCVAVPKRNTSGAATTIEEPFSAWMTWSVTSVTITPVSVLANKLILTDSKDYVQNSILSYYSYYMSAVFNMFTVDVCSFFNQKTNYIICLYNTEHYMRCCIPQCNMLSFHCQKY